MIFAAPLLALAATGLAGPDDAASATVAPLLTQALMGIAGKEVSMVSVTYPPGGASAAHRHNADVFVYVLEGSVVMQVDGAAPVTLTAGQTFHESPSDVHRVSKNASDTQPAKILAVLVKDAGAPATVPAK
jgi:quercetin dioxygenase-like cupin family protein